MQPSINSRLQHHEQQAKETKISLWGQFEKTDKQHTCKAVRVNILREGEREST